MPTVEDKKKTQIEKPKRYERTVGVKENESYRQTDIHTFRETDRQRHLNRHTNRHTDSQTGTRTDTETDR